jgi:hypothetical protein
MRYQPIHAKKTRFLRLIDWALEALSGDTVNG